MNRRSTASFFGRARSRCASGARAARTTRGVALALSRARRGAATARCGAGRAPRRGLPSRSGSSRRSTPAARIDVLNRVIAEKLAQHLGQQVIVDAQPGAEHGQGRRPRRQGAARRLHLHDHDDVDAREQRGAVQQAAVRSGQGLRADHAGLARQRPADGAGERRRTATCAASSPGPRRRAGRSATARGASARRPTSTARSWPRTTA